MPGGAVLDESDDAARECTDERVLEVVASEGADHAADKRHPTGVGVGVAVGQVDDLDARTEERKWDEGDHEQRSSDRGNPLRSCRNELVQAVPYPEDEADGIEGKRVTALQLTVALAIETIACRVRTNEEDEPKDDAGPADELRRPPRYRNFRQFLAREIARR